MLEEAKQIVANLDQTRKYCYIYKLDQDCFAAYLECAINTINKLIKELEKQTNE